MAQHEDHGIPLLPPEPRDADIGIIVKTGIGLLIFMVGCVIIAKFHYEYELAQIPSAGENVFSTEQRLPPEPRLQSAQARDLAAFREGQGHVAETFGWVDKNAGVARVPVERAIDMALEKGFPLRTPESEKVALANAIKAEAASAAKAAAAAVPAPAGGAKKK